MTSNQIRTKFLEFFAAKEHKIVASDSLVPQGDASVLFTSAGMNQFKEQFMGKTEDFRRAASCQKCLRTADLENVGKSPTHHTFFEMLGNFSFGDYFKKEAILWAWEFVTETLEISKNKLWISVHKDDAQANEIWAKKIGIPKAQLIKLGDQENFWPANAPAEGPNGPCGPCSEIFYDWGPEFGCKQSNCSPACACGRFTEIWNLVFTQYDRQPDGSLNPLPSKNIDTGMGLERIASVIQNVRENYQTDLFVPILKALEEQLKRENITPPKTWMQTKAKAIVDHIRAAVFAIADGVIPSNEERGYVIRKIIRRSIVNLKQIGINKPLCYKLVYIIGATMQEPYPGILKLHETIAGIIKKEEEMFWTILKERAPQAEAKFRELPSASSTGPGTDLRIVPEQPKTPAQVAFTLYDTYGFPLELSKEIAKKLNLEISEEEFEKLMEMQRERSRSKTQISSEIFSKTIAGLLKGISSEFVGYDYLEYQSKIIAIIKDEKLVAEAEKEDEVEIVLDKTPFYAEAGGQIGDRGSISIHYSNDPNHPFFAEIINTTNIGKAILHRAKIKQGILKKDDVVLADVNRAARMATAKNHTATHLLQYALRKIFGEHVEQSGSYVTPEKLRFDFTHLTPLPKEIIKEIDRLVNECIWQNVAVETLSLDLNQAKQQGALAFFQEKYAETVRMVWIKNHSKELCGGTHVEATGEIGLFKIINESSIAQGIRRIEAITAKAALGLVQDNDNTIDTLSAVLKIAPDKLLPGVIKLTQELKSREKEIEKLKTSSIAQQAEELIAGAQKIAKVPVIITELSNYEMSLLRKMCDLIRSKLDPVICVMASHAQNKPLLVVGLSRSLSEKGLDAVKLIREITTLAGEAVGGGKKELAQAGTKDIAGLRRVIKESPKIIEKFLKSRSRE